MTIVFLELVHFSIPPSSVINFALNYLIFWVGLIVFLLLWLFSGTLPVITYALVKINGTCLFVCNATGLPSPHVTIYKVIGDTKHVIMSYHTPISDDTGQRSYYCVAQNDFGVSFSKHVNINGMLQNKVTDFTTSDLQQQQHQQQLFLFAPIN